MTAGSSNHLYSSPICSKRGKSKRQPRRERARERTGKNHRPTRVPCLEISCCNSFFFPFAATFAFWLGACSFFFFVAQRSYRTPTYFSKLSSRPFLASKGAVPSQCLLHRDSGRLIWTFFFGRLCSYSVRTSLTLYCEPHLEPSQFDGPPAYSNSESGHQE